MSDPSDRIDELARRAAKLSAAERAAYLDEACTEGVDIRSAVDAKTAEFLAEVPAKGTTSSQPERIGPYRILHELGSGGMGEVFLGVSDGEQFRRHAAVKVVKRGLDTREVLKRFELERQLLAALNHPNIARLYDAGETDDGRPYFALEYVVGRPITEYCDTQRLNVTERLRLFCQVCSAVQHAHQNLVVHRDLKPGNILVTEDGTPRLLDFGIAKVINPGLSAIADPTAPMDRVMTPEYASPEQVLGQPITTASDVYSLGVLLYELLTGRRPYRLASRAQIEVERVICEVEPARPSTRVGETEEIESTSVRGTTAITPETVSRTRECRPDRLRRQLSGDLDNIVLMSLRKSSQRRYASAEQLAADIGRHLAGEPVIARADTYGYRLQKFILRNRFAVAASVMIFIVVSSLAVAAAWQWRRAESQRQVAIVEKDRAERGQESADFFRDRLTSLIAATVDTIGNTSLEERTKFATALGKQIESMEERDIQSGGTPTADQLEAYAIARDFQGDVLGGIRSPSLGQGEEALAAYRRALDYRTQIESDDERVLRGVADGHRRIGDILHRLGRWSDAHEEYDASLEIYERLEQRDDKWRPMLAYVQSIMGENLLEGERPDEAYACYDRALAIREALAEDDPQNAALAIDLSKSYVKFGGIRARRGEPAEAVALFENAIAIRERVARAEPQNQRWQRDLARVRLLAVEPLAKVGRLEDAGAAAAASYDALKRQVELEPDSPDAKFELALALRQIAGVARQTAAMEEASERATESIELLAEIHNGFPTVPKYAEHLVRTLMLSAEIEIDRGRQGVARRRVANAVDLADELARGPAGKSEYEALHAAAVAMMSGPAFDGE